MLKNNSTFHRELTLKSSKNCASSRHPLLLTFHNERCGHCFIPLKRHCFWAYPLMYIHPRCHNPDIYDKITVMRTAFGQICSINWHYLITHSENVSDSHCRRITHMFRNEPRYSPEKPQISGNNVTRTHIIRISSMFLCVICTTLAYSP